MNQNIRKTRFRNTICSQNDHLLQTFLPSWNQQKTYEETILVASLKEIDETLEKDLKFFKCYNWIITILIGLSFTFPVIVSLVDLNFRVTFYICSLCFFFQSQHILNLLAIRRKNFIYAKCSTILTLIKTIITLIIMVNFRVSLEYLSSFIRNQFVYYNIDRLIYQLHWVAFVIPSLVFFLQVNITLPGSFMLENLLLERSKAQRKVSLKNVTSYGYI